MRKPPESVKVLSDFLVSSIRSRCPDVPYPDVEQEAGCIHIAWVDARSNTVNLSINQETVEGSYVAKGFWGLIFYTTTDPKEVVLEVVAEILS